MQHLGCQPADICNGLTHHCKFKLFALYCLFIPKIVGVDFFSVVLFFVSTIMQHLGCQPADVRNGLTHHGNGYAFCSVAHTTFLFLVYIGGFSRIVVLKECRELRIYFGLLS